MRCEERLGAFFRVPPWVRHEHRARYAFAARYVRGKAVVDCACGDGTGSERFAEAGASSVEAFDRSEAAIAAAAARRASPKIRFRVSDALTLPLPPASAHVYIALETIEHVEEDHTFLAEVCRVLRPDGLLICSTPNRTVTNPMTRIEDQPWNPFHVREYTQDEFAELLRTAFGDVELYGLNPVPRWRVRLLERLGTLLPGHGAVRVHQALKLPRLAYDRVEDHRPQPVVPGRAYEYLIGVCRQPKRGKSRSAS